MPNHPALTREQMEQAADLYLDGKSRLQVALILRTSETAVKTALRHMGVKLRDNRQASLDAIARRVGFRKRTQLISSVFHLSQQGGQRNGK